MDNTDPALLLGRKQLHVRGSTQHERLSLSTVEVELPLQEADFPDDEHRGLRQRRYVRVFALSFYLNKVDDLEGTRSGSQVICPLPGD